MENARIYVERRKRAVEVLVNYIRGGKVIVRIIENRDVKELLLKLFINRLRSDG